MCLKRRQSHLLIEVLCVASSYIYAFVVDHFALCVRTYQHWSTLHRKSGYLSLSPYVARCKCHSPPCVSSYVSISAGRNLLGLKPTASQPFTAPSSHSEAAAAESIAATGYAESARAADVATGNAAVREGITAPVPSRRLLPLQSLEDVYARLPHYPNKDDLSVSVRRDSSESAAQPMLTSSEASAQLLGSRTASATASGQLSHSRASGQSSSAFKVTSADVPSTLPDGANRCSHRQRYTAPQGLIFRGRSVYVDAPTTVKGRLRYDRCVGLQQSPCLCRHPQ